MGYVSRGSLTVSVAATSGTGYNFLEQGGACRDWVKNQAKGSRGKIKVTSDKVDEADDGTSATWTYSATFEGADALGGSGSKIRSMY